MCPDVSRPPCDHIAQCVARSVMPCNLTWLWSEGNHPDIACHDAGHGCGAVRERQRG